MPIDASKDLSWQTPCELSASFLVHTRQKLPSELHASLVAAVQDIFSTNDLANLHLASVIDDDMTEMHPVLYKALVQGRRLAGPGNFKRSRKAAEKMWRHSDKMETFYAVYKRIIHEFILPQFGEDILYQHQPILRIIVPDSEPPIKPHCDADYWHNSNEINFWVPLVHVANTNSLWVESAPGAGDFAPFELDGARGELMRFYGNRCQHYCRPNTEPTCRVSFDFRVVAARLFSPLEGAKEKALRGAKPLEEGHYYKRARSKARLE